MIKATTNAAALGGMIPIMIIEHHVCTLVHDWDTRDHRTAAVHLRHTACQHTALFESRAWACNRAQSHTNSCHANMQCERTSLAPSPWHIPTPPHLGRAPSIGFREGSERVSRMFDSPWAISVWPVATTDRPATPSPPRTRQLKVAPPT